MPTGPRVTPAAFALALTLALSGAAKAQDGRIVVELNKFEAGDAGACQAFFLFRNETGQTWEGFEMSLAVLDDDGVIDRLLTIDAAPLNATRTALKLFEIPGIACDAISEILVHDIPACQPQNGDATDCFPIVDLVSRTGARLTF